MIIKLRDARDKTIGYITVKSDKVVKCEKCWISDVDETYGNEEVYRIDVPMDTSNLENISSNDLLEEVRTRMTE